MQKQIQTTHQSGRLFWIDALKGFGILTVVFLHAHSGYPVDEMRVWPLIKWITSFHMAFFFSCAGYFFSTSHHPSSYTALLKKKFKTLGVPYIIWGVIIGFFVEHGRQLLRKGALQGITTELVHIFTGRASYLASWFIAALIGVYCIEYALLYCFRTFKRKTPFLILCNFVLLIVGYALKDCAVGDCFRISIVMISCFFFTVGMLLNKVMQMTMNLARRYRVALVVISLLVGGTLCGLNQKVTNSQQQYGNLFLHTASAGLTTFGLFMLFKEWYSTSAGQKLKQGLEFFGQNSIIILLTHLIFLYGIRILEMILGMEIHTFPTIASFAILVLAECIVIRLFPQKLLWLFGK